MAERKKPTGKEWEQFEDEWYKLDHDGKLELCRKYSVTYDSARHWVCEGQTDSAQDKEPLKFQMPIETLLGQKPAVNLDFVAFDVESSNLTADFSILMTAVIKPFGCEPIVFRADAYKTWETQRANDKGIVQDIANELKKHAIVITHYGSNFDIPFLRAKMVHFGIEPLPPMFGIDTWRIARTNFQVSSRRLKNLVEYFDIGEKEAVEPALWMEAAYNGDKDAMDRIVRHNIRDAEVLEKLGCLVFPYIKSVPRL